MMSKGKVPVAMRMRTTLLLCMLSISFGVGSLSLVIVQRILQKQIRRDISGDLQNSILTFRNIQNQRRQMLGREVSLLAALPVLKSLMTTFDERTIRDGADEFYRLSGGDLFILASQNGLPVAVFEGGVSQPRSDVSFQLGSSVFTSVHPAYLLVRGRLYEVASQPLYFGPAESGTRLGYVLLGYAVNRQLADEVSQAASADVIFYADRSMVATTLDRRHQMESTERTATLLSANPDGGDTWLGHEHFVYAMAALSRPSDPVVELVVLKSYDQASKYLTRLNRVLLVLGALLLLPSGALAVYLATTITRPLDKLVAGARALGAGNFDYQLQRAGAREVRELAEAFDRMRCRLRSVQEELLAAERLATIGRMASSISHDLRHYLSAVYANAEFLGDDAISQEERQELLGEVRQGVRGMTDLIESLLLFSRTGESLQLSFESLPFVAERSIALVRAHPDAQNVVFAVGPMPQIELWMDILKIERAIYNLLLNACQAACHGEDAPRIHIHFVESSEVINLFVVDNGPGVPESVRVTLFQPFVSEGKASGVGLGLTLAHKIAQEHGGGVTLEESRPGQTVFRFAISKATACGLVEKSHSPETPALTGKWAPADSPDRWRTK